MKTKNMSTSTSLATPVLNKSKGLLNFYVTETYNLSLTGNLKFN